MAREAIAKKFDMNIAEYSKYWDIAPLMIASLTGYIVTGSNSPVAGVQPYHSVHPNSLVMILRFSCSTDENAQNVAKMISSGEYEIEIAFYFDGFKHTSTSFVSITAEQLKSISSKTTADGGNTDAKYIHRNQASKFVGQYITNVKKMIYSENSDVDTQSLAKGLEDQFISLLQQGMESAQRVVIDAGHFNETWSSADLRPDRITSELSKVFTKNASDTEQHTASDKYLSVDKEYLKELSSSSSKEGGAGVSFLGISVGANGGSSSSSKNSFYDKLAQTDHQKYSKDDVVKLLNEQQVDFNWDGEKFVPKSFEVYKMSDLTDSLQVALVAKQITIDKNQSAIIRHISTMNTPTTIEDLRPISIFLTGEIKLYSGRTHPPTPWLFCDGSAVSRVVYQRLFATIGTEYGSGDGITTFNIPDFQGRVPVGVDSLGLRTTVAGGLGLTGGNETHTIAVNQLPSHSHDIGSISMSLSGNHYHSINDPGHNHGGITGSSGFLNGNGRWNAGKDGWRIGEGTHSHSIPTGYTGISMNNAGSHSHTLSGETGSVGDGEKFSLMQPYQTVNYIIYTD
ncbi:unnamed protein product [Rotaria sp. Silwood2]|nr:unnamed protein product [Rotaria sp. Silwood2]